MKKTETDRPLRFMRVPRRFRGVGFRRDPARVDLPRRRAIALSGLDDFLGTVQEARKNANKRHSFPSRAKETAAKGFWEKGE
jgi:hypothetical protein